jgi:hypothetical protein
MPESNAGKAQDVSPLQYVNESSGTIDDLVTSDCGFRVKGGTQKIIEVLEAHLKEKGVTFKMNTKTTSVVKKRDREFVIKFDGDNPEPEKCDRVVLALPAPAFSTLGKLESIGLREREINFLKKAQYTHVTKFSILTNEEANDEVFYSHEGFEVWRSAPNMLTFLVGGKKINDLETPDDLVDHCLKSYVQAIYKKEIEDRKTVDEVVKKIFNKDQKIITEAIDEKPCHAAPAPRQFRKFIKLSNSAIKLAETGVGIAGTYMLLKDDKDGGYDIGFMECGVRLAQDVVNIMIKQDRLREENEMLDEFFHSTKVRHKDTKMKLREQAYRFVNLITEQDKNHTRGK